MFASVFVLVLFAIQAVRTLIIRHDAKVTEKIYDRLGMSESGQGFLAGAILLGIFIGIALAILNACGIDISTIGKTCFDVVYANGITEKVCQ
jgi:uncharacterized membrane protein